MSGGDFKSRSEGQLCARRRIDDRVTVVNDLKRVVARHGNIGATDQLGLLLGDIDRIIGRKMAISAALLVSMYGPGGAKLLPGLAAVDELDINVSKVLAAARGQRAAAGAPVVTALPVTAAAVQVPTPTVRRVISSAPMAALPHPQPLPHAGGGQARGGEIAELHAIMARAVAVHGGNVKAARAVDTRMAAHWGHLKAGTRSFKTVSAGLLRAWAAAHPEQDAAVAQPELHSRSAQGAGREPVLGVPLADRGAAAVPPPAPISPADGACAAGEGAAGGETIPAGRPDTDLTVTAADAAIPDTAADAAGPPPLGPAEMPSAERVAAAVPPLVAPLPPEIAGVRAMMAGELAELENRGWALSQMMAGLSQELETFAAEHEAGMGRQAWLTTALAAFDALYPPVSS